MIKKKREEKGRRYGKREDKEGHKLMGNIHFFGGAFGEHNHTINKLISSPPLSSPCPDHRIAPY